MNNKSNKKMYLLLIAVLLMGLIVSGGTFAYFQWSTNIAQRTNVNVTIAAGGIKMVITPGDGMLETSGLRPVRDCKKSYAYIDTKVTITNTTGTLAVPSFKLKARVKPNGNGTLKQDDLSHIHYSVVPIDSIGASNAPACDEPGNIYLTGTTERDGYFTSGNDGAVATGTFGAMNAALTDGWTTAINLPSNSNLYLPRQYDEASAEGYGITFVANKAGEGIDGGNDTIAYFRVYVWIDQNYTTTIVGDTVSDPLQNSIIEVTWSEDSIVQQVAGSTVLPAGLYDTNGTLVSTWDELVNNGDITVSGTKITDSNRNLTGTLVIADEITVIGGETYDYETGSVEPAAFFGTNITNIKFGKNSKLTTIEDFAFSTSTSLKSIEIPDSVTSVGWRAFYSNLLENVSFGKNSQLTSIGEEVFASSNLPNIKIPDSVTSIGSRAFASTDLTSIKIPSGVTFIGSDAFDYCDKLDVIEFEGTVAQWNAIEKPTSWIIGNDVPATEVICSDGRVSLE